jgi:dihydroorotase-like cyclic amidohydrolase
MTATMGPKVGETIERFELEKAWLVDPVSGREGPGEIVVVDGILESVNWLEGAEAEGIDDKGVIVAPGFFDLHAHFREPGFEDAETVATGMAAAAHGGFTSVAVMANTSPALDEPGVLERVRAAARASGSPVEVFAHGAVSAAAVATDHAPHTIVDKEVEFGRASNGISGIETALGVLLAAVETGKLPLSRAIAVLTTGPASVVAGWSGLAGTPAARQRGLIEGAPADLVVFDRGDTWRVTEESLRSKGKNSPLIGRDLSGRVLVTIAGGRLAYEDLGAGE